MKEDEDVRVPSGPQAQSTIEVVSDDQLHN